jgi:hypothetical protein
LCDLIVDRYRMVFQELLDLGLGKSEPEQKIKQA